MGDRLVSAILFGSAAVEPGEAAAETHLLVVCRDLSLEELDLLAPLTAAWTSQGHAPPLLFTRERLANSSDVFPIELLDIKETHRTLYGENVMRELPIGQENLRFLLERELKGKLIQLRESYLLANGDPFKTLDSMLGSLSKFQVLLRAALRFFAVSVPHHKRLAPGELQKHVPFDLSIFDELQTMKDDGRRSAAAQEVASLFQRYLCAVESAADLMGKLGAR